MRNKGKSKGKIHPSPSPSSSASSCNDALSVLKLLPAAILALTLVLPLDDRQVLAYMITRSIKTTTNTSRRNSSKIPHKIPSFNCDCFDCYTSFWFRWDSSPNRELIHQVIEAFEEHLNRGEYPKKNNRNRKREKMGRRGIEIPGIPIETMSLKAEEIRVSPPRNFDFPLPLSGIEVLKPEIKEFAAPESGNFVAEIKEDALAAAAAALPEKKALAAARGAATCNHKGFARKVLPDVLGVFNSRLWSLWSPNL